MLPLPNLKWTPIVKHRRHVCLVAALLGLLEVRHCPGHHLGAVQVRVGDVAAAQTALPAVSALPSQALDRDNDYIQISIMRCVDVLRLALAHRKQKM